jgi:hypothetical protein
LWNKHNIAEGLSRENAFRFQERCFESSSLHDSHHDFPWVNCYSTSPAVMKSSLGIALEESSYLTRARTSFSGMAQRIVNGSDSDRERSRMAKKLLYRQSEAEICADHQLMVTALFFHFIKNAPDLAANWVGNAIFLPEQKWGKEPDAFICEQNKPILALAYAGPKTDVAKIHSYCKQRGLPYELWGQRHVNAWYNPSCHRLFAMRVRAKVLEQFGHCKCFPAIKYLK